MWYFNLDRSTQCSPQKAASSHCWEDSLSSVLDSSPQGSRAAAHAVTFAGMVDIARQTVEFLYEENGGIPRDLYLPTIEDIKDEANKFTIDKVRKGSACLLTSPVKFL